MINRILSFFLLLFVFLSLPNCRNDELTPKGFVTPTTGALFSLVLGTASASIRGGGGGTGGGGGYQVPRNGMVKASGVGGVLLFGQSFLQPAVWRNSNGTNWEKSTYTIPGCVSSFVSDGSNTCQVVAATFNGFSKFYVLVRYSESRRGSDNVFRDSNFRLWLGTGTFLSANSISFKELNFSSIGISNPENISSSDSAFRIAANSSGIVLRSVNRVASGNNNFNSTFNFCASTDDGGSWACGNTTTSSEFVENLDNTTISIGTSMRWTNSGAPTATGNNSSGISSAIRIGSRTFATGNGGIRFTDINPSAWDNTLNTTQASNTSILSNSTLVAGNNDIPFAVNRTFNNNSANFSLARSDDNGVTWTTGGAPNTGVTYSRWETFAMVFANSKYMAVTAGTEASDNRFYIRYLESTENPMLGGQWRTVCGQSDGASGTCP